MSETSSVNRIGPPPVEHARPIDQRDERLARRSGIWGQIALIGARYRAGEMGWLTVVIGLALIWAVFESISPFFLSSLNLANLLQQCAGVGVIALGVVLVLLVGQIDLSVGSIAGMAAAILSVTLVDLHWPLLLAMLAALLSGAIAGLIYAVFFVRFGVPSFVVTLAGLLAVLGVQLWVLGPQGSLNLPPELALLLVSHGFLPAALSYSVIVLGTAALILGRISLRRRRRAAGLSVVSWHYDIGAAVLGGIFCAASVSYINMTRGISLLFVIFAGLVVILDLALRHTSWGRAVFAIGGNPQAAARAGIKVTRTYVSVFVLCSTFAAMGGIMLTARLGAAAQSTGGADTNLNAIAAAVIGGTSLFGGRGSAYAALLGILVIWSISSGLNFIQVSASVRFMITGAVLLLAVTIDSLARTGGKRIFAR